MNYDQFISNVSVYLDDDRSIGQFMKMNIGDSSEITSALREYFECVSNFDVEIFSDDHKWMPVIKVTLMDAYTDEGFSPLTIISEFQREKKRYTLDIENQEGYYEYIDDNGDPVAEEMTADDFKQHATTWTTLVTATLPFVVPDERHRAFEELKTDSLLGFNLR